MRDHELAGRFRRRPAWIARRLADAAIIAAGLGLALPLILPFP